MEATLWDLLGSSYAQSMAETIDKLARTPLSKIVILGLVLTVVRIVLYPMIMKAPKHERYGTYKVLKGIDGFADAIVYAAILVFMLVRPFVLQTFNIPSGSMIDTLRVGDFIIANKNIYRRSDPERGQIIVFKPPKRALFPGQDPETDFIKRCIGVPGDIIEWKGKKMYLNGKVMEEPYADYTTPGNPNGPVAPKEMWPNIRQADFKIVKDGDRYIPVQYSEDSVNGYTIGSGGFDPGTGHDPSSFIPNNDEEATRWKNAEAAAIPPGQYLFIGDNRNGSLDGRFWGLVPRTDIIGKAEFIWLPTSRWRKLN